MTTFIDSFSSEWLKRKRTAAAWLVLIGGFFIPLIILGARLSEPDGLAAANRDPLLWQKLYSRSWQFMGFFLLPIGVILATSLITQLEFRNNTWKQLHTTPQSLTTIFFAKLAVILVMLVQFFLLFNIGIYLTGVLPCLFFRSVPYPLEPFPWLSFLKGSGKFFLSSLPIVALQYLVSLRFKNFLVPLGIGFGLYVASAIAVHWKYGYLVPYTYTWYTFLGGRVHSGASLEVWELGYFGVLTILSYILYISRKEKG
ncbi:MAG: ABC transporter permease [Bacteroidetes bacterium]|nr:ABC transporter permease [Bacteroidota bacterium]